MKIKQAFAISLALLATSGTSISAEISDYTSDILVIEEELTKIEQEASQYGEGLITNILEARKKTLQLSLDALNFFKLTETDGVVREYTVELIKPDPDRAASILAEILKQRDIVSQAVKEASETGGLIQAIALSRAETEKLTLSQLQLGYYQVLYGLPIRSGATSTNTATSQSNTVPSSNQATETTEDNQSTATAGSVPSSLWLFVEQTDNFTDKDTSAVVLNASSVVSGDDPKSLILRCDGKGSYVIFMVANGYIGAKDDRIKVRYRFGEGKPTTERWSESTNGTSAFLPSGYNDFRTSLKTGEDFVFEISDYRGGTADSEFDNSTDEKLDYVMNGCKK